MAVRPDGGADPYAVLGVSRGASQAEIAAAYRRAVRASHPDGSSDGAESDPDRLAAVVEAYQRLRRAGQDRGGQDRSGQDRGGRGESIPVRVHRAEPAGDAAAEPDLRAGPVRRHRSA